MKSPVDVIPGRIVDIEDDGTLHIVASYPDKYTIDKRRYEKVEIRLLDGRPITDKQRKFCYALIREISEYTGQGMESTKAELKREFLLDEFQDDGLDFSLADAPVSMACAFERWLVRFMLDFEVPCRLNLLKYVDDTADYLYACVINKRCCVCGGHADLHHVERVGAGRSRREIIHEGMMALPLCRAHHNECHMMGQKSFDRRYHIGQHVALTKELCDIYKFKKREELSDAECGGDTGEIDEGPGNPVYAG